MKKTLFEKPCRSVKVGSASARKFSLLSIKPKRLLRGGEGGMISVARLTGEEPRR